MGGSVRGSGRSAALAGVAVLAVVVGAVAGYVFDGAGSPALGFWALTWAVGVAVVGGFAVALWSGGRAWARLAGVVVAAVAAPVGGMVLLFTGPGELALSSPEGLWMYPLGVGLLVLAVVGVRVAVLGGWRTRS